MRATGWGVGIVAIVDGTVEPVIAGKSYAVVLTRRVLADACVRTVGRHPVLGVRVASVPRNAAVRRACELVIAVENRRLS